MNRRKFVLGLCGAVAVITPTLMADDKHYYEDKEHHDRHEWNEAENRAYRHWWTEERHENRYREYNGIPANDQAAYWRWRHDHSDWH